MVLAYRPEYRGPLAYLAGAQTISLPPLSDTEAGDLLAELLGTDPSVAAISDLIAQRAAGNPFFAEEMVHELADRGVLEGDADNTSAGPTWPRSASPPRCRQPSRPRIDRLAPGAKQTINAAAVIGSRFNTDLLIELGVDPVLDDLVRAELIDQVRFTPYSEYAFRHPVIRSVAYESQLKSARTQLHRRLASTIESRDPASADENASLIAQHSEAAGNLRDAYGWHMRAGAWSSYRDIDAARLSWRLPSRWPTHYPPTSRTGRRCASPREPCCAGSRYRVQMNVVDERLRRIAAVVRRRWGTRRHWPSEWPGEWPTTSSGAASS